MPRIKCTVTVIAEQIGASVSNYLQTQVPEYDLETGQQVGTRTLGQGWRGFIVGGIVTVQEDNADYMAPSKLLHYRA